MTNDVSDESVETEDTGKLARILPVAVIAVAVTGFFSLAWYAYHAGTQTVKEGELTLVEADKDPVKEQPDDPGGMKVPNQDKTVYETFSGSGGKPPVERVLPSPEEPTKPDEKNWTNDRLQETPDEVITEVKKDGVVAVEPSAKAEEKVVVAETKKAETPVETPKEVVSEEVGETTKPAEIKSETKSETKPDPKPETKKAAPAKVASGKGKVQLGAFHSEAEAKGEWNKMVKKHDILAGRTPVVTEADLGEKGIYFRLQVHGVDAKATCAALAAKKQACMVVK